MSIFTSTHEKRLWLGVFVVTATIYSTLFISQPLAKLLSDQNVHAAFFLLGMFLVGAAVVVHALKTKPSNIELSVLLGIIALYVMFFLRLGLPERSHLIEYSVLAIFIHKALVERAIQGKKIPRPALYALIIAFSIGLLDECIQIFLPNRVFDINDIYFNGIAVTMAIGSTLVLSWLRKRFKRA